MLKHELEQSRFMTHLMNWAVNDVAISYKDKKKIFVSADYVHGISCLKNKRLKKKSRFITEQVGSAHANTETRGTGDCSSDL